MNLVKRKNRHAVGGEFALNLCGDRGRRRVLVVGRVGA